MTKEELKETKLLYGFSDDVMKAIMIADAAHDGVRRKGVDEPYIKHPIRVAAILKKENFTDQLIIAGALHDVMEDNKKDYTPKVMYDLLCGFLDTHRAGYILKILRGLTNQYTGIDYPELNRKKRKELETQRLAAESSEVRDC